MLSNAGVFVVNRAGAVFLASKLQKNKCILKTVSIPSEARYKNGMYIATIYFIGS